MSEPAIGNRQKQKKERFGWIMALYLIGLFIGAIGTGIITPVRTIIQTSLGADDQLGIWMITIYTLFYAAIIPISGKLADRHGRKIVFMISIFLFGVGSVICGLSAGIGSFAVLLAGRIIQAIGAGGIMPIATAEFGTSFPPEKRGMALGMVGGVYGIGNVLGATAGSAILDIFGVDKWEWIFYVNIPFCIFILIGSILFIPNHKSEIVYKIDKIGTLLITLIILSLLYGLKNLDFFDFFNSLTDWNVYLFLIIAAVLIPVFVFVEKHADDPVFHIEYMSNSQIVAVLVMGLFVGCSMMGMIFIPQFAENALKVPSGDGGYFVIILGLFAGIVSPISGGLIDKFGSKPVLGAGFIISIIGALYLAFVSTVYISWFNVIVSLVLIGLGMGLTIGTPLNYMMMRHTKDEDSNSALATLSLVRSIGTAIAPAIMVGFIAQAGAGMQDDLMKAMPEIPDVPQMEQQVELQSIVDELNENEEFRERMEDMNFESMLNSKTEMNFDMSSDSSDIDLPDDLLKELQNSDVTTITVACKDMATFMFDTYTPDVIKDIQDGIGEGIDGITEGIDGVNTGISEMLTAVSELKDGRKGISEGISGISKGIDGMTQGSKAMDKKIDEFKGNIKELTKQKKGLESAVAGLSQPVAAMEAEVASTQKDIDDLLADKKQCEDQIAAIKPGLEAQKQQLESEKANMESDLEELQKDPETNNDAIEELEGKISDKESELSAKQDEIDGKSGAIAGLEGKIAADDGQVFGLTQKMNGINEQLCPMKEQLQGMKDGVKGMEGALYGNNAALNGIQTGKKQLEKKLEKAKASRAEMQSAYDEMGTAESELYDAIDETRDQEQLMIRAKELMISMRDDIPVVFDDTKAAYLKSIDKENEKIEAVYQKTLNQGFRNMFICVAVFNLIGILFLLIYRDDRRKEEE